MTRLDFLKNYECKNIDEIAHNDIPINPYVSNYIIEKRSEINKIIPENYRTEIHTFLKKNESLKDQELVRLLAENFNIEYFSSRNYQSKNILVSKINHGFWEHFAYFHATDEDRARYRDVNLALRNRQYLSSDFFDVLVGSILASIDDPSVCRFISCTTGVQTFSECLGDAWLSAAPLPEPYELPSFKRGAVKGLLAFSHIYKHLTGAKAPLRFYDSYSNNKSFEDGSLLNALNARSDNNTVCLIIGPERLRRVRLVNWSGSHAYLCLSEQNAQAQWKFNVSNILTVVDHYNELGKDVTILFQGAVLGPVVIKFLKSYVKRLKINASFIDLGRLLDIAYEADITQTGSPLPNRTFDSGNRLKLVDAGYSLFQDEQSV